LRSLIVWLTNTPMPKANQEIERIVRELKYVC